MTDDLAARYGAYDALTFDRPAPKVLRITLDGPGLNSVGHAAHAQLADVWLTVDRDPDTNVALLCGAGLASAATTTLPELSVTADSEREEDNPRVKEVSTATRTSTPVRYVPQAIDTVKTVNVLDYVSNTLGKALEGIPNVSSGADTRFDSVRIRGSRSGAE